MKKPRWKHEFKLNKFRFIVDSEGVTVSNLTFSHYYNVTWIVLAKIFEENEKYNNRVNNLLETIKRDPGI